MSSKLTTVYLHFRKPLDLPALHRAFPPSASFIPVMENSCIISSHLTYKAVQDLMEREFPQEEFFICVAGRHYVVGPSS